MEPSSNVLNGAGNVSVDKIQRVLQAVETLNYRKDGLARSMKGNHPPARVDLVEKSTDKVDAFFCLWAMKR